VLSEFLLLIPFYIDLKAIEYFEFVYLVFSLMHILEYLPLQCIDAVQCFWLPISVFVVNHLNLPLFFS